MPMHHDIISTVGRTPLVKLNRITNGTPAIRNLSPGSLKKSRRKAQKEESVS